MSTILSVPGYGSITNRVMERCAPPEKIEVGMGATVIMWSDRHAATIVEVLKTAKGKIKGVVIQRDSYKVISGTTMDGSAEYEYTPDTDAYKSTYTLRKNGTFVAEGDEMNGGQKILIGTREKYRDPSF